MGSMTAMGIAATDASLEQKVEWHLTANFYPPLPRAMVPVCVRAIKKANRGEWDKKVKLPTDVVKYKGKYALAPVWEVIEFHRLEFFLDERYWI